MIGGNDVKMDEKRGKLLDERLRLPEGHYISMFAIYNGWAIVYPKRVDLN